jgi:hypothetical protein
MSVCPATETGMSDSYIIEVSSQTAGIVVRDKTGYRFFAANRDFNSLEGRYFRSAREAERAAALSKGRRKPIDAANSSTD